MGSTMEEGENQGLVAVGVIAMFAIFAIGMIIKEPTDKSQRNECKYTYKVWSADFDDSHAYTNDEPDENGCVKATQGIYCSDIKLTKTIKGTEECLPPKKKN